MRKMLPIMLSLIVLASVPSFAATQKPSNKENHAPVILVMGSVAAGKSGTSDPAAFKIVTDQLEECGRFVVMVYNPELPAVEQALKNNRISSADLVKAADEKTQISIGKAIDADYLLTLDASVQPDFDIFGDAKQLSGQKMEVDGKLFNLHNRKNYTYRIGNRIVNQPLVNKDKARENASLTAGGTVARQVVNEVFGASAILTPWNARPSQAAHAPEVRDLAADFRRAMDSASDYAGRKDVPNQITALKSAINLQPTNPEPRLKIASLYIGLKMNKEAIDELHGLLLFHPENDDAFKMLSGLYTSTGDLARAAADYLEIVRLNPSNAGIRLSLGDAYWNMGRIDDAENEYLEAEKLDAVSPAPHDKLANLYTAKKKYDLAIEELLQAKLKAGGPTADSSLRDEIVSALAQSQIEVIINRLETSDDQYTHGTLAREGYYQECKDDQAYLDALDKFLGAHPVSPNLKSVHSHLVLSLALLSQANSAELSFLETEKQHYAGEAGSLREESKTELKKFAKATNS